MSNLITVVISRYNEDLKWLDSDNFSIYNIIIYNKGINDNFIKLPNMTIINLDNVGRESHTYLYYVINNYNNLTDITIFLHGSCDMQHKYIKMKNLLNYINLKNKPIFIYDLKYDNVKNVLYNFTIENYQGTNQQNKNLNPESKLELSEIRPFGKWFEHYFNDIKIQHISYCGIFSVDKKDILQHSKEYYENLIKQLSNSSNPEGGHYFERSWEAVFYPMNNIEFYHLENNILNKNIFLLWFQGWNNDTPWLIKQVAESWEINNPDWEIHYIDSENLKNYVNDINYIYDTNKNITIQAKSDIIRLSLLKNYGGVWADATMLCMQPLDHWIYEAIEPANFWMYHGNGAGMSSDNGPASWFMISKKNEVIITKWKKKCDQYWINNNSTDNYFWMDSLFKELVNTDTEFKDLWLKVPYLYCELDGQSHTLASKYNSVDSNTPHIKQLFLEKPPYVLKLWKNWSEYLSNTEISKDSNGYYAIQMSKRKYSYKH